MDPQKAQLHSFLSSFKQTHKQTNKQESPRQFILCPFLLELVTEIDATV